MKVGIIRYPGSNCDQDTLDYFENSFYIWHKETELPKIDLLIIPGGFAFGDREYISATGKYIISPGTMAIKSPVTKLIYEAVRKNIPILGICNGFQILTKLNLLTGELKINDNKKFTSKKVKLQVTYEKSKYNKFETELYIANSYGNYQCSEIEYKNLENSNQIFLKYTDYSNGSLENIAGICNSNRTIFGMMPHPERNNEDFKKILYDIIFSNTRENPNINTPQDPVIKNRINALFNSEHISYKSTRKYLKKLYTSGGHVIQGPGENAGIVDIGGGYCIAIRIESHNHPTFIDPYEGAATGVGGILRDIFTMGAKPIALLDFLRFGNDENSERLLKEAVHGIADYGNCIGVANVGGDLYRDPIYNKNPIVNVGCLGIIKKENIIYGNALNENSVLIYIGSKTGNEGVDGAAMASNSFKGDETETDNLKDNIQKSDPFLERLLLEACCEIADKKLAEGMQDMGAGGLLCASVEVILRGISKTNKKLGCTIDLDKVPTKYSMESYNILVSESQERMLIVSTEKNKLAIQEILDKWDLEYSVIGNVNLSGVYSVYHKLDLVYSQNMSDYNNIQEDWPLVDNSNISNYDNRVKNSDGILWQEYDSTIGNRTIKGPLEPGSYSILNIQENGSKIVLTWGEEFMDAYQKMEEMGAKALCLVNCLNYGHPKTSMVNFSKTIDKLSHLCEKYRVPVVGGNVSLYNTTDNISIRGTPILLMMGIIHK